MSSKQKTLHEYIQLLRERRIFTIKQSQYLDYINLYINDAKCYKIILSCDPNIVKKAKKAGITQRFTIIEEGLPDNILISPETYDISRGQFILQYVRRNQDINICVGEDFYLNKVRDAYTNKSGNKLRNRITVSGGLQPDNNEARSTSCTNDEINDNGSIHTMHNSGSELE
jgi:hypothetical protein